MPEPTDPIPPSTTAPNPTPPEAAPVPNTFPSNPSGGGGGGGAAGEQPFHSASLYVGDLAPDVNEGLLFEIFNAVGPVASIRVCRDAVTRRSLGYAYVNFHQIPDAERALDSMNYTMIKSRPCRIMWSQRDPSLRRSGVGNIFVKNLHESIDNKQLYDTFSLFGNILSCKVVTDRESGKSMGYGYVHYETAEAANAAIDKLDGMLIDGQEVQVGHFMRKNDRPGLSDWTNCYCKNIPLDWNNARLNEEFSKYGEVLSATIAMGIPKDKLKAERRKKAEERKEKKEEKKEKKDEENEVKEGEKEVQEGSVSKDDVAKEEGSGDKKDVAKPEEGNGKTERKICSLGYGFVSFADHDSAVAAVENLNGKKAFPIAGGDASYELFVCRAQKKAERERELRAKFESIKLERISKFQGVNLYVKNLDDTVTDDILREEFSQMGTITSARVMRDQKDGRSRGFGFVCFSCPEEATRAVNEMNGKLIINKPIFVALAQRKDVRRAQLEAQHNNRGSSNQGQQPNAGMIRGPMATPMGYPGAAMPVYMQRPGPGGNIQPVYPMMPQMMPGATASGQQPRAAAAGQQPRGYPMMQQQRGVYPMPTYGVVPQPPARGGRGPSQAGRGGRGGRGGPGGMQQPRGAVPGRGGTGPQQQQPNNIKFNQQARNAGAPPAPVPPAPLQQPPPQPQPVPPPPSESALTASALASASPEQQKNMIGERLYPLIHASQPDLAGKITGMLLEMDNSELLHLLESPEALNSKITEALQVLEAHNAATSSAQT
eukprot:CAMPEP_0172519798 /NCGR_PEP_ID=MMETSP1066-20121228/291625_1 /TAXON_ID=671091 /ORGANISM="Coscinodiscus wailesii, Strain CCMP2513" /LENGTH=770 /DNA_ID=CAMNT_0013302447 /DNA_START=962 /DNA_END=3274 /DNA_ORIENTATION=-